MKNKFKICTGCKCNLPIKSFSTNGVSCIGTVIYKTKCKECYRVNDCQVRREKLASKKPLLYKVCLKCGNYNHIKYYRCFTCKKRERNEKQI